MNRQQNLVIFLSLISFIFITLTTMQFRVIKVNKNNILQLQNQKDLRNQIIQAKDYNETLLSKLEKSSLALNDVKLNQADSSKLYNLFNENLQNSNSIAGLTDVKGPGVIITLTDSSVYSVVHDSDIFTIINDLVNAGAEAISVNGQRVINTSEIRCAGAVVSINKTRVAAPFVIKAIGDIDYLMSSMKDPRGTAQLLIQQYNINIDIRSFNSITVEKYSNFIDYKYIKSVD